MPTAFSLKRKPMGKEIQFAEPFCFAKTLGKNQFASANCTQGEDTKNHPLRLTVTLDFEWIQTRPPGFEPGFKAPEAFVISRLDHGRIYVLCLLGIAT